MKKAFLWSMAVFLIGLYAPTLGLSQSVLAADGGSGQSNKISIEWTLGEFAISSLQTSNGWITEGFHQPHLSIQPIPALGAAPASSLNEIEYNISLAPNPVRYQLQVKVKHQEAVPMTLQLLHANGSLLIRQPIETPTDFELDMSPYASGLYIVQFLEEKGQLIEAYKITKH